MVMNDILYNYQKRLLNNSTKNYFYALDTGTGKTLLSLHHYLKYSNGEPLLIVAPPAKIKEGGWDREIQFIENKYKITIRYETLSYGVIAKNWMKYKGYFVIFDEAHYVKNPTSLRGKSALSLTKAATGFVLLTATPMSNGWEDGINYMLMWGKFRNKTHMLREHGVYETQYFGPRSFKKLVDWKDEPTLVRYWKEYAVSIKKEDALDLPAILFMKVNFKPSKEYRIIKRDRVYNDIVFDTPPKLMAGLRYYANKKDKQEYLKMLFESINGNIVVFYQFKKEYKSLVRLAKDAKRTIYTVNGQLFNLPNDKPENAVIFVQYQAGAAGIELQYASTVVFYTPTYSYQDYTQALGRVYRNGQKQKVTVYQFDTQSTVENDVWLALDHKKDFSEKRYYETQFIVR